MNNRNFAKFASMRYMSCIIAIIFIMLASSCHTNKYAVFLFDNGPDYVVNGYYRIVDNKGRIGYADSLGNTTIRPRFAFGLPFNQAEQARVTYSGNRKHDGEHYQWDSGNWFYIDTKGNRIEDKDIVVFDYPEIQPQFPGGYAEMMVFVSKNLKIPPFEESIEGAMVELKIIVNEEGKVEDIEISRSAWPELDKEFVRVIKSENFPDFLPGRMNGYPVRCRITLPFRIKFQQ